MGRDFIRYFSLLGGGRGGPGAQSDVRNKAGARSAERRKGVGARTDFGNGWSVER